MSIEFYIRINEHHVSAVRIDKMRRGGIPGSGHQALENNREERKVYLVVPQVVSELD
jgi:hypothetical protein